MANERTSPMQPGACKKKPSSLVSPSENLNAEIIRLLQDNGPMTEAKG